MQFILLNLNYVQFLQIHIFSHRETKSIPKIYSTISKHFLIPVFGHSEFDDKVMSAGTVTTRDTLTVSAGENQKTQKSDGVGLLQNNR